MYQIMIDYIEYGIRYPRKSGKSATSFAQAILRAKAKGGYVMQGVKVVWA
jgi:hypothetical protein